MCRVVTLALVLARLGCTAQAGRVRRTEKQSQIDADPRSRSLTELAQFASSGGEVPRLLSTFANLLSQRQTAAWNPATLGTLRALVTDSRAPRELRRLIVPVAKENEDPASLAGEDDSQPAVEDEPKLQENEEPVPVAADDVVAEDDSQLAVGEETLSSSEDAGNKESAPVAADDAAAAEDDSQPIVGEETPSLSEDAGSQASVVEQPHSAERVLPTVQEMLVEDGVGITGRWKEVSGNFVIYPQDTTNVNGVIHFLGGAFVGAAPHRTYRYLLEALCNEGYIIVSTPYKLGFDYLKTCDGILAKFNPLRSDLAADFGDLPLIGVGHSCGALLHTFISSVYPGAHRAANVLISWNNKPAKEAIPGLDEAIVPLSEQIMGTGDGSLDAAAPAREAIAKAREGFDGFLDELGTSDLIPAVLRNEIVPGVRQGLEVVDQVPELLASLASGTREFFPSPQETREDIGRSYNASRTLLIQFDSDDIDETSDVETALLTAKRNKASEDPAVELAVDLKTIGGTHVTPLTQNIILEPGDVIPGGELLPDPTQPIRQEVRTNFLRTIEEVKTEIVQWL